MNDAQTIKAMLAAVRAERKAIADRDAVLEEREDTLLEWLKEEAPMQPELVPAASGGIPSGTPLGKFLSIALADGKKHTSRELIDLVKTNKELVEKHGAAPGRAVNFVLQGWKNVGHVLQDRDGLWFQKQGS